MSDKTVRSTRQQLIHRPIQVQGRSRVDTWQTTTSRRRAHSATDVRKCHFLTNQLNCIFLDFS